MNILELAKEEQAYILALRREFHKNPELSLEEKNTSARICKELDCLQIPYKIVGDYGIVATIKGKSEDKMVALRADIDALPVKELNNISYKSQNEGVMHACGHDAHIAMLLGAAKLFKKTSKELEGSVKLCFQQAEEVGAGANEILEELSNYPIKSCFAIHIWSEVEHGTVAIDSGPRMSGGLGWELCFKGKGTHGAIPNEGLSPIIMASNFVSAINSARTYEISPLKKVALTIGSFNSGEVANVIPEQAVVAGTIRVFYEEDKKALASMLERVAINSAKCFGGEASIKFHGSCAPVNNDIECTKIARNCAFNLLGERGLAVFEELMPSENYGLYLQKYPGVMAFLGGKNEAKACNHAHHNPHFNIDEDVLFIGSALHVSYAHDFLKAKS